MHTLWNGSCMCYLVAEQVFDHPNTIEIELCKMNPNRRQLKLVGDDIKH